MRSATFGYICILVIVASTLVIVYMILNNNISLFTNDRNLYVPPRFSNTCGSDLYAGGPTTAPDDSRTYWDTGPLLMIVKEDDNEAERTCSAAPCTLVPKIGSDMIVYDKKTKSITNSYHNSLGARKVDERYIIPNQPFKHNTITNRNPYNLKYNNNNGELGYVVTEDECMDACKDDCLGYFMIPGQFKSNQPYCFHLGVNKTDVQNDGNINLLYSCSPGKFDDSLLNNMVGGVGDVYGKIKMDGSPLTENIKITAKKI